MARDAFGDIPGARNSARRTGEHQRRRRRPLPAVHVRAHWKHACTHNAHARIRNFSSSVVARRLDADLKRTPIATFVWPLKADSYVAGGDFVSPTRFQLACNDAVL